MKLLISFLIVIISSIAHAEDFCHRTNDDIRTYLLDASSRISFKNNGGLFNGGVCWWHSRLQRSSAYLVKFEPNQKLPSESEVWTILKALRSMNRVVTIPGYKDFATFSEANKNQIQKLLNDWQATDGFLNQQWIRGISGQSILSAEQLKNQMDYIFNFYKESPLPVWLMAQIKGVTAHAFLLVEMIPSGDGYELKLIDSNKPLLTRTVYYSLGNRNLTLDDKKYTFIPYTGFQKDFKLIAQALQRHCPNNFEMTINFSQKAQIEIR